MRCRGDCLNNIAEVSSSMTHEEVRDAIASTLQRSLGLAHPFARALALSAHPWPDSPLSREEREDVAAELIPTRSLTHPNPLEAVTDRLLRIAESLRYYGYVESCRLHEAAAHQLQGMIAVSEAPGAGPSGVEVRKASRDPLALEGLYRSARVLDIDSGCLTPPRDRAVVRGVISGVLRRGSSDLGELLGIAPISVSVYEILNLAGVILPWEELDAFLERLDPRRRDILATRTYPAQEPETLESIATRWGVTRERIRQIEKETRERFERSLADEIESLSRPIRTVSGDIIPADRLKRIILLLATETENPSIVASLLYQTTGPWLTLGEWLVHKDCGDALEEWQAWLEGQADKFGLLSDQVVARSRELLADPPEDFAGFIQGGLGLVRLAGSWGLKDTQRARVMALLRAFGRPVSKYEIATQANLSLRAVSGALSNIEEAVRASKTEWALNDRVDDVYEGVYFEIEQRIDQYGGAVRLDILYDELLSKFKVTRATIDAYLSSDLFTVDGQLVSRSDRTYNPRPPGQCDGAVQVRGHWGQLLTLDAQHWSGRSLKVSWDIAYANGLRPGDDLLVPTTKGGRKVSVIWRIRDLSRSIDVGRVSDAVAGAEFEAGEQVVVVPTPEWVGFFRPGSACHPARQESEDDDDTLSLPDDDVSDPLIDLL